MKFPSLHGRTVLVTGATGFTGRALVRALLAQGATFWLTPRVQRRLDVGQPAW